MPDIKNVLVTAMISPESKEKLKQALATENVTFCMPYGPGAKEEIAAAAKGKDVCILNGDLDESILASEELKWVHCCRAGVEKSAIAEVFERDIILTSSSGRSAPALAEHALMFMMALTYDLPMLMRAQHEHKWAASREYFQRTGMFGKTVGIIGLGKTGKELAKLCKSFHMTVLGWRRSAQKTEYVDEVYASEEGQTIEPILKQSDYVVLCVELNDDTYHLIGEKEFAAMKKSAYLVNMGRGGLVEEPVLIEALKNGTIAGAGLDTFDVEPLPEDSLIWDLPNVIVTPHITPQLPDREERMLSYVYENIKAYREGGNFINPVTQCNMLTKGK